MSFKVKFFGDDFIDAIGAGIYGIYVQTNDREELLYIGESVFVLVRCATHLYEIVKGNGYLGFTKEVIENNNILLVFKLFVSEPDQKKRKEKENKFIELENPRMQSGIRDRVKSVENMIIEMTNILNR